MINTKYESIEEIPENYRDLYTENNGVYVLTEVVGIKTQDDIDRLQEGLRKERDDHKATKRSLQAFSSLGTADELIEKLDRFDELEASSGGKLDEDKLQQLVEARLKSKTAPLERELSKLRDERDELSSSVESFVRERTTRTIHDEIRAAAKKANVADAAIEDALLYSGIFEIDEVTGKPITKQNAGVTPGIEPQVWLSEVLPNKPHWLKASQGAGGVGGQGKGSNGTNPFSKEGWNLTQQGLAVREDREKAEQLAKSAGTFIGGPRPE